MRNGGRSCWWPWPLWQGRRQGRRAKVRRARVKDIASVEGVRDNQLVGYGIVVGLHGTGDSSQTVFPLQTLESALERMGVNLQGNAMASMMQTRNMAAVFLSGTLPPFAQPGNKIDVTVSSAGDARSLEGGVLLLAPLYGPDGQIYAEAQGPMVLGGYAVTANGSSKSVNYPTTARIPSGAIVERGVPLDLARMRTLSLLLDDADFHTAEMVAGAINQTDGAQAGACGGQPADRAAAGSERGYPGPAGAGGRGGGGASIRGRRWWSMSVPGRW